MVMVCRTKLQEIRGLSEAKVVKLIEVLGDVGVTNFFMPRLPRRFNEDRYWKQTGFRFKILAS